MMSLSTSWSVTCVWILNCLELILMLQNLINIYMETGEISISFKAIILFEVAPITDIIL